MSTPEKPKPKRTAADGLSRWKSEAERREVNAILDRNGTWREVAAVCAKHGRKGVTSANVTNYRKSPDRRAWTEHQQRLEAIRQESELTAQVVRHYSEHGGSPAEAGLLAAAEVLTKVISSFPETDLRGMMQEDPRKFISAVESLAKITAFIQRERAGRTDAPPAEPTETPEERARRVRDIFGLPQK
jgi:hypothetical protein